MKSYYSLTTLSIQVKPIKLKGLFILYYYMDYKSRRDASTFFVRGLVCTIVKLANIDLCIGVTCL
jgi:hypothetical protein